MVDGERLSDDALVKAVAKGNESAAAALYHRYVELVFRICYRILLDEGRAKDCTQEVWLKAFNHSHRYRVGTSFTAWLSTIAVRTAIDEYRKLVRTCEFTVEEDTLFEMPLQETISVRGQAEESEVRSIIESILGTLSAPQRAAFVLRHYEGATYEEIAHTIGCSKGTVKTHVHRAVQAVRKRLLGYVEFQGKDYVQRTHDR